jgi:hypothetical protein
MSMISTSSAWKASLAGFAAVLAAMALLMALSGSTPAKADSGFCGVRVQGPTLVHEGADDAYTIRNKCASGYDFRLYFYSNNRYSSCAYVSGYEEHTWIESTASPNWNVENC